MKFLLIAGSLAILLGVVTALLGLVPITLGTATSYYLCPIWAPSLLDCLRVAGPSIPSQLAFTLLLVSPNHSPPLIAIVLMVSGIVAVTVSIRHHPKVDSANRGSQT